MKKHIEASIIVAIAVLGITLCVVGHVYTSGLGSIQGNNIRGYKIAGCIDAVEDFTASSALARSDSGKICTNWSATTDVTLTLPADPTGCTFVINQTNTPATNLIVDPSGSDHIIGATDTAGDTLTANGWGETITLKGISTSKWIVEAVYPAAANWVEE